MVPPRSVKGSRPGRPSIDMDGHALTIAACSNSFCFFLSFAQPYFTRLRTMPNFSWTPRQLQYTCSRSLLVQSMHLFSLWFRRQSHHPHSPQEQRHRPHSSSSSAPCWPRPSRLTANFLRGMFADQSVPTFQRGTCAQYGFSWETHRENETIDLNL